MACHLFCLKSLLEPMLTCSQLDPQQQISMVYYLNIFIRENTSQNVICKMSVILLVHLFFIYIYFLLVLHLMYMKLYLNAIWYGYISVQVIFSLTHRSPYIALLVIYPIIRILYCMLYFLISLKVIFSLTHRYTFYLHIIDRPQNMFPLICSSMLVISSTTLVIRLYMWYFLISSSAIFIFTPKEQVSNVMDYFFLLYIPFHACYIS